MDCGLRAALTCYQVNLVLTDMPLQLVCFACGGGLHLRCRVINQFMCPVQDVVNIFRCGLVAAVKWCFAAAKYGWRRNLYIWSVGE